MDGIAGDLAVSFGGKRTELISSDQGQSIDWAARLDAWAQSGLSLRAFAQRENLSLSALYYHRAKQRRGDRRDGERASSPDLVEITRLLHGAVGPSPSGVAISPALFSGGVTITLPNGISVVWPLAENSARLGDVVRVLRVC